MFSTGMWNKFLKTEGFQWGRLFRTVGTCRAFFKKCQGSSSSQQKLVGVSVTLLVIESSLLKLFMLTLCYIHADIKQYSFCIIVNLVLSQFIIIQPYAILPDYLTTLSGQITKVQQTDSLRLTGFISGLSTQGIGAITFFGIFGSFGKIFMRFFSLCKNNDTFYYYFTYFKHSCNKKSLNKNMKNNN